MKIVLLGDSLATQRAGIHYYGMQLVKKIARQYQHHELFIVLPWPLEEITSLRLTPIIVPIWPAIPFHLRIRQLTTIPRRLRKLAPDIVIELAHFGPFGLPANTKRITVIHDLTPIHYPQFHDRTSVLLHRKLMPRVLEKADYIFTNSLATKSTITADYPNVSPHVTVIYPEVVEPSAKLSATMPPPYWPYFLSVGTMEPRKNLQVILAAFEIYCANHPSTKTQLIFAGAEGWKNKAFEDKLSASEVRDRIVITGRIERADLWMLYRGALALISASVAEGFGLPLLEAMSLRVPLILSDIPVYREVGGKPARFFQHHDHDALANHLEQIAITETDLDAWREQSYNQYLNLISIKPEWPIFD